MLVTGAVLFETAMAAAAAAPPALTFTPSSGLYGQVVVGQAETQDFSLANQGGVATGPLTLAVSGSGRSAFTITSSTCSGRRLAPSATCAFSVRFTPAGAIGYSAALTATSGGPRARATLPLTGNGVVAGHLYWTTDTGGSLVEAGLDGSNPHAVVTNLSNPYGVAVSSTHLYWTTGNGTVVEAGLNGSNPQVIATVDPQRAGLFGLAVDGSHLYWATYAIPGTIVRAGLGGDHARTVVSGQDCAYGIALDHTHLYWTNACFGMISRAGLDGSNAQVIATGQDGPMGVAVSSSSLYWANEASGTIVKAGLDGSNPQIIVTGQANPTGVAVTGSLLYWSNRDNGTIMVAGLDGSSAQVIATGQFDPTGLAVSTP
jgi:hypothetical protein